MTSNADSVRSERRPITYVYDVEGHKVEVTRRWVGQAYARNGNVHNPTQYYVWESRVDGKYVVGSCATRSSAYEHARAEVQGVEYYDGSANPSNHRGIRLYWLVADEMKANYQGRKVSS